MGILKSLFGLSCRDDDVDINYDDYLDEDEEVENHIYTDYDYDGYDDDLTD